MCANLYLLCKFSLLTLAAAAGATATIDIKSKHENVISSFAVRDSRKIDYDKLLKAAAFMMPNNNNSIIEPIRCYRNEDCYITSKSVSESMVICDEYIHLCILGVVEEKTKSTIPKLDPPSEQNDRTNHVIGEDVTTSPTSSSTSQSSLLLDPEFHSIPVVVWILFTIPFISIIILGIICGRRLKMQSENIQQNLRQTTINGVHVERLLSQQIIVAATSSSAAASLPPPTYEKATGEIPPSYETVQKVLQEKRKSILDLRQLNRVKDHHCDDPNRSHCGTCCVRNQSRRAENENAENSAIESPNSLTSTVAANNARIFTISTHNPV